MRIAVSHRDSTAGANPNSHEPEIFQGTEVLSEYSTDTEMALSHLLLRFLPGNKQWHWIAHPLPYRRTASCKKSPYHPHNAHVLKDGVICMAIDYVDIGQRIRQKRIEKGLTQEKLSELIGVGPSHISHIEGGTTVPSFEVFITFLNVPDCSSDELLRREIKEAKPICDNWLTALIEVCDTTEIKILSDALINLKATLRKNKISRAC